MFTQQFEALPDEKRLETMVDLLRYENASLKEQLRALEKKQDESELKLQKAEEMLEEMQAVIDLQNAQYFADKQKSPDLT